MVMIFFMKFSSSFRQFGRSFNCWSLRVSGDKLSITEKLNSNAKYMYNANYLASKRDDFVDKMITMIRSSNPMTIVHLIGHFYSQEYANKWLQIAACMPERTFWFRLRKVDTDIGFLNSTPNIYLISEDYEHIDSTNIIYTESPKYEGHGLSICPKFENPNVKCCHCYKCLKGHMLVKKTTF